MASPAAGLRLLQVDAARVAESVTAQALQPGDSRGLVRLTIEGGLLRHDLVLTPNAALGQWAQSRASGVQAYEGHLPALPGSWARLTRTRSGWTGIWFDGQRYFGVDRAAALADAHPLAAALGANDPLVFNLRDAVLEAGSFAGDMVRPGITAEALIDTLPVVANPATALAVLTTRRLNVAVIADAELVALDGNALDDNLVSRMNVADGVFANQVGVRLAITSTTKLTSLNQPFSGTTPSTLLDQLRDYRVGNAVQQAAGLSHLITGRNLDDRTVGIAFLESLCSDRFSASLSEGRSTLLFDGLIAAHEIGHVFGAPHDAESGSACSATPDGFLMAPQLNGSSTLSACSLEKIQPVLTRAQCLAPLDAADVAAGAPLNAKLAFNQVTPLGLSIRSTGNVAAGNVTLAIDLPGSLGLLPPTVQVSSGTCTITGLAIRCDLGTLAAGAERTATLGLKATTAGSGRAVISVGATGDGLADNNNANVQLTVEDGADLSVGLAASATTVTVGASTLATLTLQNLGLAGATDAQLNVTVPAGLTLTSLTGTGITCTQSGNSVTCPTLALANAATARLDLSLQGATVGSATLTASVTASRLDPQTANNTAQLAITVNAVPVTPPPAGNSGGGGGTLGGAGLLGLAALLWQRRRAIAA